jgi:flagellar hook-basal body complex protein FliE
MSGIGGIGGSSNAAGLKQVMALRQEILERSRLLQELKAPSATSAQPGGPAAGFGDALQTALQGVAETQNRASALSEGYEKGEVVDVAKVMLARQEAGVAFEATLQVRNRLLSAYQEIMRMGV